MLIYDVTRGLVAAGNTLCLQKRPAKHSSHTACYILQLNSSALISIVIAGFSSTDQSHINIDMVERTV